MIQKIGQNESNNRYYKNYNNSSFKATPEEILEAVNKAGLKGKGAKLLTDLASYAQELSKKTNRAASFPLTGDKPIPSEIAQKKINGVTPIQIAESLRALVICYPRSKPTLGLAYTKGEVAKRLLKQIKVKHPDVIEIKKGR